MIENGKVCSICGEIRGADFWKPKKNRHGNLVVGNICLSCLRSAARERMRRLKEIDPTAFLDKKRRYKRNKMASMTAEERHNMRLHWKEWGGRPCRTLEEANKENSIKIISKVLKRVSKRIGMELWIDWYNQSHTMDRWSIECQFFNKKPWQFPLLDDKQSYAMQYKTDESFMIKERLRRQIVKKEKEVYGSAYVASCLKQHKNSCVVERLTSCSLDELRMSLQDGLAKYGHTWHDFMEGELHIDHIIPKSMFDIKDHKEARLCWHKDNLRLIDKRYNLRKSNRVVASLLATREEIII